MDSFKKMLFVFILTGLVTVPLFAATHSNPNQGIFTSVDGKVQVKTKKGHKTKTAQKDLTVFEGDRIITSDNSKATIRLFDGSSLDISPKTEFILSKLQKPTEQDKVIQFKLIVGKLLAAVEKLTTSKSSFEIEAGGVVCGVRGTHFSMESDGQHHPQIFVQVFSGSVYTIDTHGTHYIFHPGPPIKFLNGSIFQTPNNPNNPNGITTGLKDLNNQFGHLIFVNGQHTLSSIQGSVKVNVGTYLGY